MRQGCRDAGGSDADGTESAGALAQGTFRTLARAADDMAAVFADDTPELSSLLLTWALQVSRQLSLPSLLGMRRDALARAVCCQLGPQGGWCLHHAVWHLSPEELRYCRPTALVDSSQAHILPVGSVWSGELLC